MRTIRKIFYAIVLIALVFGFANPLTVRAQSPETRIERLIRFDALWRSGTPQQWAAQFASGPTALARMDARQPEEEVVKDPSTGNDKIVVAGLQVANAQGLYLPWPACLTSDQPNRVAENATTRKYTPDPQNGSTLYTEVTVAGDGLVTIYADCSNWDQLVPAVAATSVAPSSTSVPVVTNPPVVPTNPVAPDANFWRNVGGWALVVLGCLAGLALLALAIFGIVRLIQWIIESLRNRPTKKAAKKTAPKKADKHVTTSPVVNALKAEVPGLTDTQAKAIIKAYPSKDSLKTANVSAVRKVGKMGDDKAKKVIAWANH